VQVNFSSTLPYRLPPPANALQVNFCKNTECPQFGVEPEYHRITRGRGKIAPDGYVVTTNKGGTVLALKCKLCGQQPNLKSNHGIVEEFFRLTGYFDLDPEAACCPNPACDNRQIDVRKGKAFYYKYGKTTAGSQRYKCRKCGLLVSVNRKPTARQRLSFKNGLIMKLLMNKMPLSRICEIAEVSFDTLYRKIDYIHQQCLLFSADKERKLASKDFLLPHLYIASDRQDYIVSWTNTNDKRNIIIKAVCSVEMETGYVFGMHVNFDPALDSETVHREAALGAKEDPRRPFLPHARVWLESDHKRATRSRKTGASLNAPIPPGALEMEIANRYAEALLRGEIEASDEPTPTVRLPQKGMQIHEDYTLYGHFLTLKFLTCTAEKIRFFLDQDSGMRAACLSLFSDDIKAARCDAFYVSINKDLTIHEKQKLVAKYKYDMEKLRAQPAYSLLSDKSIRLLLIADEMARLKTIGAWDDRWLNYPFPDMSEPEKAVCYLTNRNDLDEMHLAHLYHMASLHAVDSYFNQVRTRLSPLDRPRRSKSNPGRLWLSYLPYDPGLVQKMLDMLRVYHNYHLKSKKDKKTPAMRLGLAKGPISIDDIVNYRCANSAT